MRVSTLARVSLPTLIDSRAPRGGKNILLSAWTAREHLKFSANNQVT